MLKYLPKITLKPHGSAAPRDSRRWERGQSLVEMSIGFVLLLTMLSGLLDLGRAYFIYVALEDGVGEGVLYLSLFPACRTEADSFDYNGDGDLADLVDTNPTFDSNGDSRPDNDHDIDCTSPNNAEYRTRFSGGGLVNWDTAQIRVSRPAVYGVGDPVSVSISYTFQLLTPVMPRIAGVNPITLSTNAAQIIIGE